MSVGRIFIGKNTGMSCHSLLQGIFPTHGLNPSILHCRWILYHLSHHQIRSDQSLSRVRLFATPWTVAGQAPLSMGFSSKNTGVAGHFFFQGSSRPRDRTWVSCIVGRHFNTRVLWTFNFGGSLLCFVKTHSVLVLCPVCPSTQINGLYKACIYKKCLQACIWQ